MTNLASLRWKGAAWGKQFGVPFLDHVNQGVFGRSLVREEQVVKASGDGCFYERRTKRHEY